jgi:hypothetical protein
MIILLKEFCQMAEGIIQIPVLWDNNDTYFGGTAPLGVPISFQTNYVEIDTVVYQKPIRPFVPSNPNSATIVPMSFIKNTSTGRGFFSLLTLNQILALIEASTQDVNASKTFTYEGFKGTTLTDTTNLVNQILIGVFVDGVAIDLTTLVYSATAGTITFPTSLSDSTVIVTCYGY